MITKSKKEPIQLFCKILANKQCKIKCITKSELIKQESLLLIPFNPAVQAKAFSLEGTLNFQIYLSMVNFFQLGKWIKTRKDDLLEKPQERSRIQILLTVTDERLTHSRVDYKPCALIWLRYQKWDFQEIWLPWRKQKRKTGYAY